MSKIAVEYKSFKQAIYERSLNRQNIGQIEVVVADSDEVVGWVTDRRGKGLIHVRRDCYGAQSPLHVSDLEKLDDWDYCKRCLNNVEKKVAKGCHRVSQGGLGVCGRRTKADKACQNPCGPRGGACRHHR